MTKIISRNFRVLCDFMDVYQFMIEVYEKDWRNGVPAPFLEYALSSDWMDKSLVHRWKLWEDNGCIVGLVFYENPVNDVYFSLRPGYEKLADEMVKYAVSFMPHVDGHLRFVIFDGQNAIKQAAAKIGFQQSFGYIEKVFDFEQSLNYSLPDGFHFVESKKLSVEKIAECCWKGFDHEKEEGPWDGDAEHGYYTLMAPHMNQEDSIVIENDEGEYVCYAGMWWTPENHLAYMEPLLGVCETLKPLKTLDFLFEISCHLLKRFQFSPFRNTVEMCITLQNFSGFNNHSCFRAYKSQNFV